MLAVGARGALRTDNLTRSATRLMVADVNVPDLEGEGSWTGLLPALVLYGPACRAACISR
eukprot:scaffold1311_cov323-Prasinococcus_capsulatus_cf.AAC.7